MLDPYTEFENLKNPGIQPIYNPFSSQDLAHLLRQLWQKNRGKCKTSPCPRLDSP